MFCSKIRCVQIPSISTCHGVEKISRYNLYTKKSKPKTHTCSTVSLVVSPGLEGLPKVTLLNPRFPSCQAVNFDWKRRICLESCFTTFLGTDRRKLQELGNIHPFHQAVAVPKFPKKKWCNMCVCVCCWVRWLKAQINTLDRIWSSYTDCTHPNLIVSSRSYLFQGIIFISSIHCLLLNFKRAIGPPCHPYMAYPKEKKNTAKWRMLL